MQQQTRVITHFWGKLKTNLARIPFAHKAAALYFCARDPATPLKARGTLYGALAYFIVPLDVLPDMLLGLGFTDDLTVLMAAASVIANHLKPEHEARAHAAIERLRQGQDITE
jgi:uncharacterized membrane protein YkvA (DUF1232 family)